MNGYIFALAEHAIKTGLIQSEDKIWAVNRLLETMGLDEAEEMARRILS